MSTVNWSGYIWNVRTADVGSATSAPGPNHWGDDTTVNTGNAFVDASGLHLRIINDGTYWRCVELDCQSALGYGRYQWVVDFSKTGDPMGSLLVSPSPSILNWDDNTVLSLFTYDPTNGTSGNFFRESDIQFSRLSNPNTQSPVLLATQPGLAAGGTEANQDVGVLTGNGPYTCTLVWQSGQSYFSVVDANGATCCEHVVSGAAVQAPASPTNTNIPIMRLWLNSGSVPTKGTQEVILQSFTFAASTTHALVPASNLVAPFITYSTLILLHRPGPDSPDTLNPVVPIPSGDIPDYLHEYAVPSLVSGIPARARGTYSVMLSVYHWDSPDVPRFIEVVIHQYDYPGAAVSASGQAFPPVTRTVTPSADSLGGLVEIGEVTLPVRDIPDDNTDAYFTIAPYSANSLDRFQDCLLLDTAGQTILIAAPGRGYRNFYIDEPDASSDIGRVSGSSALRSRATSVLQYTQLSGGPLTVDPGSGLLVAYGLPQAPGLSGTYSSRYFADRTDS